MNLQRLIGQLEQNLELFAALEKSWVDWHWKPAPERWNALEVMCHLADEERRDFRSRLQSLLEDSPPGARWVGQDPADWIAGYARRQPVEACADFYRERAVSLEWLRRLEPPDWLRSHAKRGLRAGDLMLSWVAHDDLHLKQLLRLRYEYLSLEGEPFSTEYAGDW